MGTIIALFVGVVVGVVLTLVTEETRVAEAHRDEESWRKRACTHGSTSFDPSDPDGGLRRHESRQS